MPVEKPSSASPTARGKHRVWPVVAVVVLTAAAFAATFTRVYNYDVLWQLASGQWMLDQGRVLDFDPFSIDGAARWVNVHWLFQVVIALAHAGGDFAALTVLKASLAAAAMFAFAFALRRRVPPAWLIVCGLAMLWSIHARIRIRPEAFTYAFLVLTIVLIDSVRHGAPPRRLWWLVPVMLAWVNMHGLYILGVGVVWGGVLGTWLDRRLGRACSAGPLCTRAAIAPLLVATAAVLITPWPMEAALHPLLLWTRVSGEQSYYTYGVGELAPTWRHLSAHATQTVLGALAALALLLDRRRASLAHLFWLAAFVGVGLLAVRNAALVGPLAAYLLAIYGGRLWRRLGELRTRLQRTGPWLSGLTAAATVVLTCALLTGSVWRATGSSFDSGVGLLPGRYPLGAAAMLRDMPAEGNVLCDSFGDAGAFIYAAWPKRRVFMDGRLETHTFERFVQQHEITRTLRTAAGATRVQLPPSVRFVHVGAASAEILPALMESPRFRLLYVGPAGTLFARNDWPGFDGQLPPSNLAQWDRPLARDGLVEGFAFEARRWWRQNPVAMNYRFGSMLLSLGRRDLAAPGAAAPTRLHRQCTLLAGRYLAAAHAAKLAPPDMLASTLAQAHQQRAAQDAPRPAPSIPADMDSACALAIYHEMNLSDLSTPTRRAAAMQYVVALKDAHQIDAAASTIESYFAELPIQWQVNTPRENLTFRDSIYGALAVARTREAAVRAQDLSPLERADALAAADVGLGLRAIADLRGTPPTAKVQMKLGDLLLRMGMHQKGRDACAHAAGIDTAGELTAWALPLRKALCDWAAGDLYRAYDALEALKEKSPEPLVCYYFAAIAVQLGSYDAAAVTLANLQTDDPALIQRIANLRSLID